MADRATPPTAPTAPTTAEAQPSFFSPRARRQLGLFAAGAGFVLLSTAVTRRSIVRRHRMSIPLFFHHSNHSNPNINGALEALEALTLATLNVFSFGIMATGGFVWAFDIATLEDMRKKVRVDLGVNGGVAGAKRADRADQGAEQEIEEWFSSVLERKEFKALRGERGIKTKGELELEQQGKEQVGEQPEPKT